MSLVRELVGLAGDAIAAGTSVSVKTNLGPELTIGQGEGGLLRSLGIRAVVIVRDRNGRELGTIGGEPPETDLLLAAAIAGAAALLVAFLARGVLKR